MCRYREKYPESVTKRREEGRQSAGFRLRHERLLDYPGEYQQRRQPRDIEFLASAWAPDYIAAFDDDAWPEPAWFFGRKRFGLAAGTPLADFQRLYPGRFTDGIPEGDPWHWL